MLLNAIQIDPITRRGCADRVIRTHGIEYTASVCLRQNGHGGKHIGSTRKPIMSGGLQPIGSTSYGVVGYGSRIIVKPSSCSVGSITAHIVHGYSRRIGSGRLSTHGNVVSHVSHLSRTRSITAKKRTIDGAVG